MDTKERIHTLFSYVKASKKNILVATLFFSLASVFLIIFGVYTIVFHYYGNKVIDHYCSLLKEEAAIFLSSGDAYRKELRTLADTLRTQRGIIHAWCADNSGRLVYHTDETLHRVYQSRRLPADYYASIRHMWTFREGDPQEHVVPLNLLSLRISIPLYVSSRAEYAFVLGIDAKRFLFLPEQLLYTVPMLFGYVTFMVVGIFFLLYLWTKHRFAGIALQARALEGGGDVSHDSEASEIEASEIKASEIKENTFLKKDTLLGRVYTHLGEREEPERGEETTKEETSRLEQEDLSKKEGKAEEPKEEKEARDGIEIEKPEQEGQILEEAPGETPEEEEEQGQENREEREEADEVLQETESGPDTLRGLMPQDLEQKFTLFQNQTLALSFIHGSSFSFRSPLLEGTYVFSHYRRPFHFYVLFECYTLEKEKGVEQLREIGGSIQKEIESRERLKEIVAGCNDSFFRAKLSIDLSLLMIDEIERRLEYSSCGKGGVVYLKQGEEEVKNLDLELPGLGALSTEELMQRYCSADISFVKDDILVLLPPNGPEFLVEGKNLAEHVTASLLAHFQKTAHEIGVEIYSSIKQRISAMTDMPETGYVVLKLV